MALAIDATIGGTASNSYVTIAEADAYFEAMLGFSTVWAAFSDAVKTQRLVLACRALERLGFTGEKYDEDQSLSFPRAPLDEPLAIPKAVKDAQCEMAALLYYRAGSTGTIDPDSQVISALSALNGLVDIEYQAAPSGTMRRADEQLAVGASMEAVKALLRPWLMGTNSVRWT